MSFWARLAIGLICCLGFGAGGYYTGSRVEHTRTLKVQADWDAERAKAVTDGAVKQAQYSATLKTLSEAYDNEQRKNGALAADVQLARERLRKSDTDRAALLAAQRHTGAVSDASDFQCTELAYRTLQSASDALAYTFDQEMSRCNALRSALSSVW